jgi:hypothetical protein
MEEKVNVKMMELTTQNKEMKRKPVEKTTQQKEWHELRKKEEI